jgi:2-keto-3-deoxy-L-rhamnonate aldolase RhmA
MVLMTSLVTLAQDADTSPDMALLEYLAELVEVDGELVGPMDMATDNVEKDNDEQANELQKAIQKIEPTDNSTEQEDKDHD